MLFIISCFNKKFLKILQLDEFLLYYQQLFTNNFRAFVLFSVNEMSIK